MKRALIALAAVGLAASLPAAATQFFFSTGNADGLMATASRPDAGGAFEIESGDDFLLTNPTRIESATFQGLLTGNMSVADIGEVRVEIYRVFPLDSDVGRTSGPPTFSTSQVPTRVNSPSDVALLDRDTGSGNLAFTTADLGSFVASNSVTPGGIHPIPGQTTGGNGPASGEQVTFNVDFTTPFTLAPGHYFFVPQVQSTTWRESSCGCRRRSPSRRPARRSSPTCRAGRAINSSIPTGCASAPISWAPARSTPRSR